VGVIVSAWVGVPELVGVSAAGLSVPAGVEVTVSVSVGMLVCVGVLVWVSLGVSVRTSGVEFDSD